MEIKLDKNQRIAASATATISVLIILLLMMLSMTPPYPPEELPGMEVSLGNSLTGSGTEQPEVMDNNTPPPTPSAAEETSDVTTQDNSDVFVDKKVKKTVENDPVDVQEEPVDETPTVNDRALFDPNKVSSNGGSKGPGNGEGVIGNIHGDPSSNSAHGSGGTGGSWSLVGRSVKNLQQASKGFTESGKVTVKIYVNRQGKVVKAEVQMRGTKTNSEDLHRRAKQAALRTTFNIKGDAPELQTGTIVYNFVIQN